MKCRACQGECQKVNKFVLKCCRCSGITYLLQCSACHESRESEIARKVAANGKTAASSEPWIGKGKTLAVKSGTQATTYVVRNASSGKALQKELEIAGKTAAENAQKKAVQQMAAQSDFVHIAGGMSEKAVLTRASEKTMTKAMAQATVDSTSYAAKEGAKLGAEATGKALGTSAKMIKGASTPWQLGSVAAEFGVGAIASAAGASKTVQEVTGKVAGVTTSAAIGAAVGGPVGAAGAVLLWGVGEGISQGVDAIINANKRSPGLPCDPVPAAPMCDKCVTSMAIPSCYKNGLNLCRACAAQL